MKTTKQATTSGVVHLPQVRGRESDQGELKCQCRREGHCVRTRGVARGGHRERREDGRWEVKKVGRSGVGGASGLGNRGRGRRRERGCYLELMRLAWGKGEQSKVHSIRREAQRCRMRWGCRALRGTSRTRTGRGAVGRRGENGLSATGCKEDVEVG